MQKGSKDNISCVVLLFDWAFPLLNPDAVSSTTIDDSVKWRKVPKENANGLDGGANAINGGAAGAGANNPASDSPSLGAA